MNYKMERNQLSFTHLFVEIQENKFNPVFYSELLASYNMRAVGQLTGASNFYILYIPLTRGGITGEERRAVGQLTRAHFTSSN